MIKKIWNNDEGVLTLEWILLLSLIVIGVIVAMSTVRDAINDQLHGLTGAISSLDTSYNIPPPISAYVDYFPCQQKHIWSGGVGSYFVKPQPRIVYYVPITHDKQLKKEEQLKEEQLKKEKKNENTNKKS
jgi:Flp pilus assembly pilin Flp